MAFVQQLRVPGPTPLPERVLRAASRQMINHRGPEFAALLRDVEEGMRWALRTENDVLIYPCSGTGGLEAAVVNVVSPGEQALFCTMGSFGDRWADIGAAYGADVLRLSVPAGEPIDPEDVERILAVVKGRGKLLAVDSVSGAGCTTSASSRCRRPCSTRRAAPTTTSGPSST